MIRFVFTSSVLVGLTWCLGCLKESGEPVDWFIIYKLPKKKSSGNPLIKDGVGFYYMDSKNPSFSLSGANIQKKGHALYNTLQQVYNQNGPHKFKYAMYNDQPPPRNERIEETFKAYGHTKGMYAFDEKQGFWLISSVPQFPAPLSHGYNYEQGQTKLGQAMICVSLSRKYLTVIEDIFNITNPNIYDPKRRPRRYYSSVTLVPQKVFPISTVKGQSFRFFAKSSIFGKDLYDGLVAPDLSESLYVHTWEANWPSTCNMRFKVMNIEMIKFPSDMVFKSNSDHSKWTVSTKDSWVCVGDINRATSQFKRGGGTMCLSSVSVWRAFNALIKSVQNCTKYL
ncbi:plancitoxin-1-like [Saccostrea echinata]|uniref:plancitoxin-1-like n=1 Tax=Saccostrea echinata TaxID=191078 RepID=UPI002A7FCB97|nr:plancitoxin-1-like [Saccostrea echinata]